MEKQDYEVALQVIRDWGEFQRDIVFVVVNFNALAQASDFLIERRQVVFLCWMQDSNPEGLWNRISSRLNAHWQTDWAIQDQTKNLNWKALPYDHRAFSPLDPTAVWPSHLALVIDMFVVVNFDALAQASDFQIGKGQVVFLCWMQDSNPEGLWNWISSRLNAINIMYSNSPQMVIFMRWLQCDVAVHNAKNFILFP